ncbi:MAG: carboxypeptidase-like regulatory domain-containing protein [Bacteroidetes bacterium]|nr:carboxypeptidase-like regulatory domain-containing protein [Bacteroidota bacterium]
MEIRIRFFIFIGLTLVCLFLNAQKNEEKRYVIIGSVIDRITQQPISFAHIHIPEKKMGTASDLYGSFNFEIGAIDTLNITAVGYYSNVIILSDSVFDGHIDLSIELIPRVYELEGVTISPYLSYEEFKRTILNYEPSLEQRIEEENLEIMARNLSMLASKVNALNYHLLHRPNEIPILKTKGPVSALYDLFSKEAKSDQKLLKLIARDLQQELLEQHQAEIKEKFNPTLVGSLTGLSDQGQISEFMNFCSFHDDLILYTSDYHFYTRIVACYQEYLIEN